MNPQELQRNPQLSDFFVRDLNKDPAGWALADQSVDAVVCCCSVQYLQYPERVFTEIYRVLRPGGVCIISFSNRMFYEKAIQAWRDGSGYSRVQLVKSYFMAVRDGDGESGFRDIDVVKEVKIDGNNSKSNSGSSSRSNAAMTLWSLNPFQAAVTSVFRMLQGGGGKDPFYAVIAHKQLEI
jgi:SAM-dependent methyltransferase